MNYRITKLLAETNLSSAGTKTIDINVKDLISRIVIAWRIGAGAHGMDSYPHTDITKIELIDGSEVLHSLNGGENQALCIYDRKVPTMNHGQHMSGDSEYSVYGIDFGRFLHDPLYAFDPTKFVNPQLKITYVFNNCYASGVSSGNLEVWAHAFDEKQIMPVGFLTAKEIKDFSISAAGVYDYVELPTDRVMRKLFIQGYRSAYEPWYQVIEARLNEDNDKRVPFDWDLEDYHRTMKGVNKPVEEQLIALIGVATKNYFVTPTDYWVSPMLTVRGGYGDLSAGGTSRGGSVAITCAAGGGGVNAVVRGYLPNHVFEFPFGDQMDPDDWYDVTKVGSLELRLKTGTGTSGNIRTFVQQLRRY